MTNRVMPEKFHLGDKVDSTMAAHIHRWEDYKKNPQDHGRANRPAVMGYLLPDWQRPLVWTYEQMVSFMESAWMGIPIGSCSYNQCIDIADLDLDGLLIDGQQRMFALQCYLEDQFPVFGYRWSETTIVDQRSFKYGIHFPAYITKTKDVEFLKKYYNLMNFSGTAHTEDQRA